MKDNNNINIYIVINYKEKEYQLLVNYSSTVSKLIKIIMTYFKLNSTNLEIFYKNLKLEKDDTRPIYLLFDKDPKPSLYIFNSKTDILPNIKKQTYLTLFTNISKIKFYEIVEKFFEYKKIRNDAEIENNIKGMYVVTFSKASLCSEFKEFYDNYLRLDNFDYHNETDGIVKNMRKNKLILPTIRNNRNNNSFKNKNEVTKDDKFHDVKKYLNKVKLNNSKWDMISEKCIMTRNHIIHKSENKNKNKSSIRLKHNNYKGEFKYPYLSNEQKYRRDKYLDKKNWINKQGFIIYSKVNSKENFIPNYVGATPSESPLLFNFRNVSKNKWINPKGFL